MGANRFSMAATSCLPERQFHYDLNSSWSSASQLQIGLAAVQDLQTRAQITNADTHLRRLPVRRQTRAVVVDTQAKAIIVARTGNAYRPSRDSLGNAVLDGIFHEWLQQQIGNLGT